MFENVIPRACRNKKPRNIGDENMEPISTLEYIEKINKIIEECKSRNEDNDQIACFVIGEAFAELHCNKKYPENFNIYKSREDKLYMYENNKWSEIDDNRLYDVANLIKTHLVKMLSR